MMVAVKNVKESNIEVTFGILLILMLLFVAIPLKVTRNHTNPIEIAFQSFIKKYNKSYSHNQTEYRARYHIFEKTLDFLKDINVTKRYGETAEFGLTKFSDLSDSEFQQIFLFNDTKIDSILYPIRKLRNKYDLIKYGYPLKKDWRNYGVVTKVRNQGACGSCYAQSVIATIESKLAIQDNFTQPIEFSVQQMIDCSQYSNYGCFGGDTCNLLEWLKNENISILPDEYYPQLNGIKSNECQTSLITSNIPKHVPTSRVVNYTCFNFKNHEYEMIGILAKYGPIAASVNGLVWKNYLGGVIKFHCNGPTNHAVQIVGYDLTANNPYYLVRNSWGPEFGLNGYAKISIGANVCNIASEVSTIDVEWE